VTSFNFAGFFLGKKAKTYKMSRGRPISATAELQLMFTVCSSTGYTSQQQQPILEPAAGPRGMVIQMPELFPPCPLEVLCPTCQEVVLTAVEPTSRLVTWLIAGGLCLLGLVSSSLWLVICHLCPVCTK